MLQTIDVSDLPEPLVEAIKTIVRTYREEQGIHAVVGRRSVGWARGVLPELPPTFFEPLPDDLMDLFEGKVD